mmetsp:Transcript_43652/g.87367  ORF Transcript_43652/g.87367 Transcript_43652/m.87367 type:complete len:305 (-) Transcript_43652:404-1318(-)
MGSAFSGNSSTALPASTASLCVLPLRTNGQSRFSITPGPMPRQLVTRLAEAEYHGIIAGINTALQPLSGFGFMSLLLPFLVIDILTICLLSAIDPWLLTKPWEYPVTDLLLSMGLEFGVIFVSFPLMVYAINRRMSEVQRRVREMLDDSSRRFGGRGISFQLKQGMLHNGAGTNMWVEVQLTQLIHVQTPVPVPVPTIYPLLLPSTMQSPQDPLGAAGSSSTAGPFAYAAAAAAGASAGGTLSPQQVEMVRLLQENQLLRQYLAQCHALNHQLIQSQQRDQATNAAAATAATATATAANAAVAS